MKEFLAQLTAGAIDQATFIELMKKGNRIPIEKDAEEMRLNSENETLGEYA